MTRKASLIPMLLSLTVLFASGAEAAPRWPSLAQQLERDKVARGSALERLIQTHQDFGMLRPEEATDGLPVPPWLRVMYRKQHPDRVYSADDPMGGYPLLLKEIHEWMVTHQDLRPGKPQQDVRPLEKVLPLDPLAPDLSISGTPLSGLNESAIRINNWNNNKVIAASNDVSGSGRQAQYWSADAGITWGRTSLPLQPGDSFHTDPTVEWTSDGTAWATTLGIDNVLRGRLRVYKSVDGGATWTFDSTASGGQMQVDKQMSWVDSSATSPYKDTFHLIWTDGGVAYASYRRAGGAWSAPLKVSSTESTTSQIGTDVKTNAYGDVFGFWHATGNRRVVMAKSTDGGATFPTRRVIATTYAGLDISIPAQSRRRALVYVSAGAYRTLSKNLVYATWTDLTGSAGCAVSTDQPGTNTASTCKTRIWFARSTNGGLTWAAPRMLNNQAGLNDQFNQWMVVDEKTGQLAVIYYDTVGDPGRKKTDVYYQGSFDDGETWTAPFKVTTAQSDETTAGAHGDQYGDYNGLSGYGRLFFPSWTDRRTNGREEIWTSALVEEKTDVWSADGIPDTGLEPDPAMAGLSVWNSPDIRVRNAPGAGPHQNPIPGVQNFVYVKVRNRDKNAAVQVPVRVYATRLSTGAAWPTAWTLVGTAYIPSLAPNASTEVMVPWNVPAGTIPWGLAARLDTAQDPPRHAETPNITDTTRQNNNFALKLVRVVDLRPTPVVPVPFLIRNPEPVTRQVQLIFVERHRLQGHYFLQRGGVIVTLDPTLASRWVQAGAQSSGVQMLSSNQFRIVDPSGAYLAFPLLANEEFMAEIRFESYTSMSTSGLTYLFDVLQNRPSIPEPEGFTCQIEAP